MPTLTIDLPESAYRDALTFDPKERARLVAIMFSTARSIELETEPDYHRETDEADLEAIGRGIAAAARGDVVPGDVVFAQLREQLKKR
jgi:hypothetical protein